ncbi:MAG: helix-turn-helix transcriptional regulator [Gemmatimonadaceae bacterium]
MSDDRMLRDWEADRLARLAARAGMRRASSPYYRDARFAEWLAADVRGLGGAEPLGPAEIALMAAGVRARVLARQLGVRLERGTPTFMPAPSLAGADAAEVAALAACAPRLELAAAAGAGRELWDEPCERWVRVPAGLPPGRHVAITVAGDSMTPLLEEGDVVLVRLGAPLRGDSVVLARRPDEGYVIKRVGRTRGARVELVSLNPAYEPVAAPRALVAGVVVARWRAGAE